MATIKLTVKSNFSDAQKDIKAIGTLTETEAKRIEKFTKSFSGTQIDSFIQKNQRAAAAVNATRGPVEAAKTSQMGLRREIEKLIRNGMDPESASLKKLRVEYDKATAEVDKNTLAQEKSSKITALNAAAFLYMGKQVLAAAGRVVAFGKQLIDSYEVQEQAEIALKNSIEATGRQSEISLDDMKAYASGLQSVTLFGDEATLSSMALLQSLANLDQKGLETVTPVVMDFATKMGVDLNTAMSLVGKTLGSSTNGLSRYGIQIDMSGTKAEKLASLTQELTNKFGGAAKAAADSATGGITQLSNTMGDLKEAYGRNIAEGINPFVRGLKNIVTQMVEGTNKAHDLKEALNIADSDGMTSAAQTLLILEAERDRLGQIAASYEGMDEAANTAYENARRNIEAYNDSLGMTDTFLIKAANSEERKATAIKANSDAIDAYTQRLKDQMTTEEIKLQKLDIEINKLVQAKAEAKNYGTDWIGIETLLVSLLNEKNDLLDKEPDLIKEGVAAIEYKTGIVEEWRQTTIAAILEINTAEKKANEEAIAAAKEKRNAILNTWSALSSAMTSFSNLAVVGNNNEIASIDAKITAAEDAGKSTEALENEKRKLLEKNWKAEQAFSLTSAIINTAVAVSKALTAAPPPWNLALAAISGVAGAAEIATIAGTAMPSFESGGNFVVPDNSNSSRGDSQVMKVNPGEYVDVTPRGETSKKSVTVNAYMDKQLLWSVTQEGFDSGAINISNDNVRSA